MGRSLNLGQTPAEDEGVEDKEEEWEDGEDDQAGIETVLEKFGLDPNSTDLCFSSFSIAVVISSSVTCENIGIMYSCHRMS